MLRLETFTYTHPERFRDDEEGARRHRRARPDREGVPCKNPERGIQSSGHLEPGNRITGDLVLLSFLLHDFFPPRARVSEITAYITCCNRHHEIPFQFLPITKKNAI